MILFLSEEAQGDLWDIFQFSVEKWGERRAIAYQDKIEKAFALLISHPHIGRARGDWRLLDVESHTLVYVPGDGFLKISRIVHSQSALIQFLISEN